MNLAAFYHSGMYPEIYAPDRFHLRFSFRAASGDIERVRWFIFIRITEKKQRKKKGCQSSTI